MNKLNKQLLAILTALFITLPTGPSASAFESPAPPDGLTLEASLTHGEAAYGWASPTFDDRLSYLGGARFDRLSLDTRIYGGANLIALQRPIYALHLQLAAGPRAAFKDQFGIGAWSALRARGVWQWSRVGLHAGLVVDTAAEFAGQTAWRLRPGGDLGLGFTIDSFTTWLNLNAGYSIGGQGPGGVHLGGSLGVQW